METGINVRLILALSAFFRELKNKGGVNYDTLSLIEHLTGSNQLDILIADDDDDDKELFEEAVAAISPRIIVTTVSDGKELMKKLYTSSLPDLIFLDLNMPSKNGFECLSEIRSVVKFKEIPVLIYSTTANPEQIENTYMQGATFYIQKPSSYKDIIKLLQKIFSFSAQQFCRPLRKEFVLKA